MNKNYRCSVIVCYHKRDSKLFKALKSIENQIQLPTEIILVEDSLNIIYTNEEIREHLIKNISITIIRNKKIIGLAKSMNRGIAAANTMLIFRLDYDDTYLKNHIEKSLKNYENNKKTLIFTQTNKYFNIHKDSIWIDNNHAIHSSWLINLNIQKDFRYLDLKPEDYATASFYLRRNHMIILSREKTVKYFDNIEGVSKHPYANKNISQIRRANFLFCLKKNKKFSFFKRMLFIIFKINPLTLLKL